MNVIEFTLGKTKLGRDIVYVVEGHGMRWLCASREAGEALLDALGCTIATMHDNERGARKDARRFQGRLSK